ncbi:RDD family protein [uncultured Gimesia sp.]|mgnify:CR=1 FL=1|uniref:RDD family protein n=1 Tax=uncultured Gimesia sp. TaxID=1678688 RepID=UPI0030D887B3|tara:strand:- start:6261 stop:6848 length:588 start_codon:yes stop_codon:yes gene_type:complete
MPAVQRDRSLGEGVYFAPEDYIGFRRRIVIYVVDGAVLVGLMFAILFLTLFFFDDYSDDDPTDSVFWIWVFFIWLYLTVLKASRVRTVGYWITGARILTLRGTKPSVFRMTYRLLLSLYSPFNIFFDLMWVGVDQDRQSLTDRFAGTCVVRKKSQPAGRSEIHFAYYTALCFCYFYPCAIHPRETGETVLKVDTF